MMPEHGIEAGAALPIEPAEPMIEVREASVRFATRGGHVD
ncbi:ABC transporter ATP-binding protein, partial [Burkholderia sp. Ax-1720]|nr:ABC transporter ATP-binding protein [Burkholderia sp. Ax-1720]